MKLDEIKFLDSKKRRQWEKCFHILKKTYFLFSMCYSREGIIKTFTDYKFLPILRKLLGDIVP